MLRLRDRHGRLTRLFKCEEALLEHPQVQPEVVELLHVAQRNIDMSDIVVDLSEVREFPIDLRGRHSGHEIAVDFAEIRIPQSRSYAWLASASEAGPP